MTSKRIIRSKKRVKKLRYKRWKKRNYKVVMDICEKVSKIVDNRMKQVLNDESSYNFVDYNYYEFNDKIEGFEHYHG